MKPQAWQTDRGPALVDVIVGIGYLLGLVVVAGLVMFGVPFVVWLFLVP